MRKYGQTICPHTSANKLKNQMPDTVVEMFIDQDKPNWLFVLCTIRTAQFHSACFIPLCWQFFVGSFCRSRKSVSGDGVNCWKYEPTLNEELLFTRAPKQCLKCTISGEKNEKKEVTNTLIFLYSARENADKATEKYMKFSSADSSKLPRKINFWFSQDFEEKNFDVRNDSLEASLSSRKKVRNRNCQNWCCLSKCSACIDVLVGFLKSRYACHKLGCDF